MVFKINIFIFLLIIVLSFGNTQTKVIRFYVSSNGSDLWEGTKSRPFATVDKARDKIREIKKKSRIEIIIMPGIYPLKKPLIFGPEDSGTKDFPVIYRSLDRRRAYLLGGMEIKNFKEKKDGIWKARVPGIYFNQVFVNGKRRKRAFEPDKGFFRMDNVREKKIKKGLSELFVFVPKKTLFLLRSIKKEEVKNTLITAFHKWDITKRFLEKIDDKKGILVWKGRGLKPWNPLKKGTRFRLGNFRAALDEPGEWYLDKGTLLYKPKKGEKINNTKVFVPLIENFIIIKGDPKRKRFVEYIKFEGISFLYSSYKMGKEGFGPSQAAYPLDGAIHLDWARNIEFDDIEISHIATYAIWFKQACKDCALKNSRIWDTGGGGIKIGEPRIPRNNIEITEGIVVKNNLLKECGRIFSCAVGIWIGQSRNNKVIHNEISDLYYTGISVGWRWGYGRSIAKNNYIAYNKIHNIGKGLLSDMGGIYTLGRSEGTKIIGNVIYNVESYSYGGWGLYADEGSTGILFEKNLVFKVKTGGFHQHYGRENTIRNNIFAYCGSQQIQATRVEKHISFIFEKNIVIWEKGKLFKGPWRRLNVIMDKNIYWRGGRAIDFSGLSFKEWKELGRDIHSIIKDPMFINPKEMDFRLKSSSPALKLGFRPFDPKKAGLYKNQ